MSTVRQLILLWEHGRPCSRKVLLHEVTNRPKGWVPRSIDDEYEYVSDGRVYQKFSYQSRKPNKLTQMIISNVRLEVMITLMLSTFCLIGYEYVPPRPLYKFGMLVLYGLSLFYVCIISTLYICSELLYARQEQEEEEQQEQMTYQEDYTKPSKT